MQGAADLRRGQVLGDASKRGVILTTQAAIAAAPNKLITLSGDVTGTGNAAISTTLATVNSSVGAYQGITVNAKGLVTAAANQNYLTTAAAASTYAPIASPTLTGTPAAPTAAVGSNTTQIATTAFVQRQVSGNSSLPLTIPAGVTSGMMGFGYLHAPASTGRILVVLSGSALIGTANATADVYLMYGAGTAPAHGAAQTGTQACVIQVGNTLPANCQVPAPLVAVITGLTVGTIYWFDVYVSATSGTASFFFTCYSFLEV